MTDAWQLAVNSFAIFCMLSVGACALIGWLTNRIAIKMVFRPHKRIRIIGPIGWQGVLARHADRFARDVADIVTSEFFTLPDLARQINPAAVHAKLMPRLLVAVDAGLARFVDELPATVRRSGMVGPGVLGVVRQQLLEEVARLTPELRDLVVERCETLVDLHSEIVKNLTGGNVGRLEDLIMEVSAREFRWIEYYGAIFGAGFALLQIALVSLGGLSLWIVPALGAVVGLTTNWLAVVMLFSPRNPVTLGPFTVQGLFPSRQGEIALAWARVLGREVTFGQILDLMLERGFGEDLRGFVTERLDAFLQTRLQLHLAILAAADVDVRAERISEIMMERLAGDLPMMVADIKASVESQIDVAAFVQSSLEDMDKGRFENVLRGLVKQDEIYLIAYGGLLGATLGLAQMSLFRALL